MKQLFFFSRWVQRSALLLTMLAFSWHTTAQTGANYLSIFGNPGVTSCNINNQMPCTVTPASSLFTGIPVLIDVATGLGSTLGNNYQNSCYDKSGQLLFSVNGDGIYGPDGTYVFGFAYDLTGSPVTLTFASAASCSTPYYYYYPTGAISEIVIFPVPGKCNSYYVVFWCGLSNPQTVLGASFTTAVLRCIEVDLTANFGNTSMLTPTWYTFNPHLLDPPTCVNNWFLNDWGAFEIAADAANTDGSRDVYTLNPGENTTGAFYSAIRKWHISNTGALPSTVPAPIGGSNTLPLAKTTKAKIFTVGGQKLFSYVSGQPVLGSWLITYDLTTASTNAYSLYAAPVGSGVANFQNISGFEYLPSFNKFVVAYDDETTGYGNIGGFGYVTPVSPTIGGSSAIITAVTGSFANYCHSDLELDKNGDMLMIYDDLSGNGSLAYLKASALTSSFTSTAPTRLYGSCTGSHPISTYNFLNGPGTRNWYLGSQIRGENYSTWGSSDIVNYVVPAGASITWTPTNNPVYNASGSTTPVTSMNVDNITIPAGSSLTINGMTIQNAAGSTIIVQPAATATSPGGRLVLNNTTLTNNSTGCSVGGSGMWGGVFVNGNSTYPQGGVCPQGRLTMNSSTISYAQIGVLLGQAPNFGPGPHSISLGPTNAGGICEAYNSYFFNNSIGVYFDPYQNTGSGFSNLSRFTQCIFNSTDITTVSTVVGALYEVYGMGVSGINFYGADFTNSTGTTLPTYGIYALDMGFTVTDATTTWHSIITGFTNGIYHQDNTGTTTASIMNAVFNDNTIGISLNGSFSPFVIGNTFNVPNLLYGMSIYVYGMRSIGVLLNAADAFSVYNNKFQSTPSINNWAVGVLASNTNHGGDDNLINNNSFTGLGAGNLANYRNNAVPIGTAIDHGLWYKCNTNTDNLFDISSIGSDPLNDGIRQTQGDPTTTIGYPLGLPAGNTFSSSISYPVTVYNIYTQDCVPLAAYYYAPASYGGLPTEQPGNHPVTAYDEGTNGAPLATLAITIALSTTDQCGLSSGIPYGSGPQAALHIITPTEDSRPDNIYLATINNINYYMNDSEGVRHRDSLYYWVRKLGNGSGDLMLANLMVQDSLIDSANSVYNAIVSKYGLDSIDAYEIGQGRSIMNILISNRINHGGNMLALDSTQADSLRNVVANSRMWPHVKAETWLHEYDRTPYTDTFLFPTPGSGGTGGSGTDSNYVTVSPNPNGGSPNIIDIIANTGFLIHKVKLVNVSFPIITYTQTFSGTTNHVNMNVAAVTTGIYTLIATDIHGATATVMFQRL